MFKQDFQFSFEVNNTKNQEFVVVYNGDLYFVQYGYDSIAFVFKYSVAQINSNTEQINTKIKFSNGPDENNVIIMKGKPCVDYATLIKSNDPFFMNMEPFIGLLFNSQMINCNVILENDSTVSKTPNQRSVKYCKCKWNGCEIVVETNDKGTHEQICPWRLHNCCMPNCKESFRRCNGEKHLEGHLPFYKYPTKLQISFKDEERIEYKFSTFAYKEFIYVVYGTCKQNNCLNLALILISNECLTKNITICFYHDHCNIKSKSFSTTWMRPLTISENEFPPCYKQENMIYLHIVSVK